MKCPACGFDSPLEMRFCGACGTRLATACGQCGFANPLIYRFCGRCGTKLVTDSSEPALEHPAPLPTGESLALSLGPHTVQLEGERRVVSVLVTDLTDSSPLLEQVGTEGWVELMNRILHILEAEIFRFGGEVSQFRGDGLVAFFGATSANEDDPERAVLAALSMQRALNLFVHHLARPEVLDLQMRVGVDTGEVVVAGSSDRQHWEETAMGLAVTIAARMEAAAEPGTVLVSEHTYRLVESYFEWQPLGEITIKGISQPIAVYRPGTHIASPEHLLPEQAIPDLVPRIGREAEFHALVHSVEGLFDGRGSVVALVGEKGNGKSFLLNEVRRYFAHRGALLAETHPDSSPTTASLTWVRGMCRSYSQTWPYFMWVDLFHDWLELRQEGSKEEKRACLRRRAEELWGSEFEEHYPYLATFLGLPLEDAFSEKIQHLDGESLRQRFFLAVRSWIEAASRSGPVALVFTDMHWADASSLALLKYCLPICDNETLLWMLAFRPEREASIWDFYHHLEVEYPHRLVSVNLPPLTEEQSCELIQHLLGPEILPEEACQLIIQNSGGNPYYILELVRSLIDRGALTRQEGVSWQMTRKVSTLDMPNSLQQLLLTRIDRLSPQARLVFQIAAVIGPVFWLNMLQALLGETHTLKADLAALQRAQFIQESGRTPELGMQYSFKSSLIRDTAYESLLSTQRAVFHLKAAEYLENLVKTDDLVGYMAMLAYHYQGAGNNKRELFYSILAAEQARKIYANAEALQHYNRAVELIDRLQAELKSDDQNRSLQTQRFEVLNGRREVLFQLGQFEASHTDTLALLPLARQMADDPAWLIDALLAQAEYLIGSREELDQGLQLAQEAFNLARQSGNQRGEMRSMLIITNARYALKNPGWLELAERALALARQDNDIKAEVNLLLGIGGAYGMDDLPRSREYLSAALSRSVTLNDKAIELVLLEAIGQQCERDGDYYQQLTEYEQKRLKLSREIGNSMVEGKALMFCGQIQALYLGDYETGLEMERQALHIWEKLNLRLFPLVRIAQIQTEQGRYTDALEMLERASPLGEQVVDYIGQAGLDLVKAILFIALGDEQHLQFALEITSQIQYMVDSNLVSRQYHMAAACKASAAHVKLAQSLAQLGTSEAECQVHLQQALEASQTALNLYQQFGFVQVIECTSEEILFHHSQALAANDRPDKASEFLKSAYDEMMRKYDLIPTDSPFRKTYLENIQLHRDIQVTYLAQIPA
jgi:predicted ATPase/class 3 adenylate cyclase